MSKQALVSIVTPSLNQGKFIHQAIDSVLSQGYPHIEYLVIDGGSSDGTTGILRSYGNRLRWVSEPDTGQAQAINKGWRRTRGEIITWLNADDLLAPGAVLRAVEAIQTDPGLGGVYGDCTYVSEGGDAIEAYPVRPYDYDLLVIETENFIPQPGTFLRRSVVERVGGLDESFHYVLDHDLWLRMGLYAPMKYLPDEIGRARVHKAAKTLRAISGFAEEFLRMYHKLLAQPGFPPHLRKKERGILHQAYVHSASFAFWGGKVHNAHRTLWRAWGYQPFPRRRTFWLLFLFSVLGEPGLWLAETLHGNPFRFEKGLSWIQNR